jgi:hypothetical protein
MFLAFAERVPDEFPVDHFITMLLSSSHWLCPLGALSVCIGAGAAGDDGDGGSNDEAAKEAVNTSSIGDASGSTASRLSLLRSQKDVCPCKRHSDKHCSSLKLVSGAGPL